MRSFYDTKACCHSPMAHCVQEVFSNTNTTTEQNSTSNLLAHIRYATHGKVLVENLHPFVRELWGISWCFAHNGDLAQFANISEGHHVLLGKSRSKNLSYHAIGDTDSEAVFCAILDALKAEFQCLPTLSELHAFLLKLCAEIEGEGDIFNFILLCGPHLLFAYSLPGHRPESQTWNGLYYLVRTPSSTPKAPNDLADEDYCLKIPATPNSYRTNAATSGDSSGTATPQDAQRIAIIATKPLTNEAGWIEMKPHELLMFDRGVPHSKSKDFDTMERQGRGLSSKCMPKEHCPVCQGTPITKG